MKVFGTTCAALVATASVACTRPAEPPAKEEAPSPFESQVAEYVRKFPYQDTYNYAKRYTEGDPARFNVWVLGAAPALVNDEDRYHINDTTAVKNDDGTVTFTFKQDCRASDVNCLEVPAGRFDVTARYYLPHQPIIEGTWKLPGIELVAR